MIVVLRRQRKLAARFAALLIGALGVAAPAVAALGEIEASVPADQMQLRATLRTMTGARFTVHELKVASGTAIREYVAPSGLVFAVAWDGPSMPDLRQLLGTQFDRYAEAVAARRFRRGPVLLELPGLTVHSTGHMRAFTGNAYIPEAIPPGVAAEDIQ
ncbi:MAG TPA: DUF2844 domain-containing protein [Casimicrobiaceae bacterium]|nr:DUF2844 domain-containing protein [Casimicrobiaceae bacterium]